MFVLGGDSLDYWLTQWVLGEDHLWFVLLVLGFNFVGCSWLILRLVDEKMKKGVVEGRRILRVGSVEIVDGSRAVRGLCP